MNSFQDSVKANSAAHTSPGTAMGSTMRVRVCSRLAPSTSAHSSTSRGTVCAALFAFTLCWNEFIYALTFISQSANKTAVVGVTADLIRGDIYYWGSLMAGAVLASVPIVVIYVWFLDYYVSGLTAGAVKG